jgi:hypothetical protein
MSVAAPVRATGFHHRVADHAATGALRDLLEHHRLSYAPEPLSEGAVFGLSGAFDLAVRIAPHGVPAVDLDGRSAGLESELCAHLGIDAALQYSDDADEGWEALRAELDAGSPTLVRVDLRELDYRSGERHDTRHAIVVIGYDDRAQVAWVYDRCFPEPQRCTLQALACARASRWGGEPVRNAMLRLAPGSRLTDVRDAIDCALRRTVRSMREGRTPAFPNVRSGLAGIDALADCWPELPAVAGPRLAETLTAIRFRIRESGTGGALYRSLQARFLHDAAALLGSAELGLAALVCDDLSDAWRALASATEGDDPQIAHRSAAASVRRVRILEHAHVEALEARLDRSPQTDW